MDKITGISATTLITAMALLTLLKLDLGKVINSIFIFVVPIIAISVIFSIVGTKNKSGDK